MRQGVPSVASEVLSMGICVILEIKGDLSNKVVTHTFRKPWKIVHHEPANY